MFAQHIYRSLGVLMLAVLLLPLSGCPKKPPTKSYNDALEALKRARNAKAGDCAKEELKSAEKMMAAAQKYMDNGKFEEAKVAFDAARKLADKAREEANLNKADCLKKKRKPPPRRMEGPPTVVVSPESPTPDNRQSLKPVYFGFNQYKLEGKNKDILQQHAEWLKRNSSVSVQIEGHCDRRGSVEYNLTLGERRALAVKRYLERLGIPARRIQIISYGHQRPADPGITTAAHAKNRRAEFKVNR